MVNPRNKPLRPFQVDDYEPDSPGVQLTTLKRTMLYLLLATYGTILLCELVGDKSLYTITSLTMRFRPLYVFCGFSAAFMIKIGVAVLGSDERPDTNDRCEGSTSKSIAGSRANVPRARA